jgi:hypothetical protein
MDFVWAWKWLASRNGKVRTYGSGASAGCGGAAGPEALQARDAALP